MCIVLGLGHLWYSSLYTSVHSGVGSSPEALCLRGRGLEGWDLNVGAGRWKLHSRRECFDFCWVDWIPFEVSEVSGHHAAFPLEHWWWKILYFAVFRTTGNICGPEGVEDGCSPWGSSSACDCFLVTGPGFDASVWLSVPLCAFYCTEAYLVSLDLKPHPSSHL